MGIIYLSKHEVIFFSVLLINENLKNANALLRMECYATPMGEVFKCSLQHFILLAWSYCPACRLIDEEQSKTKQMSLIQQSQNRMLRMLEKKKIKSLTIIIIQKIVEFAW